MRSKKSRLETEFRKAIKAAYPKIEEQLDIACTAITKAAAIANKHCVPFRFAAAELNEYGEYKPDGLAVRFPAKNLSYKDEDETPDNPEGVDVDADSGWYKDLEEIAGWMVEAEGWESSQRCW